jgi:ketosteroid isomerase-like protein
VDPLALASRYFDAWRRRDPDAIAAAFAADGTYWDPGGDQSASSIAAHARRLFERFPDLAFEPRGATGQDDGAVVGRWTMRRGVGDRVVRGADFLTLVGDRVAAVERYFDRGSLATLGGATEVGTCVRVRSGRTGLPGAFGITWQEAPTEEGREEVRVESERILAELPDTPGFIGGISATIGDRFLTVTAWDEPNAPFALIRGGSHRMAAVQFFGPRVYSAGWTGVWTPTRLHPLWVRCPACRKMVDHAQSRGRCGCGGTLPSAPAYW